MKSNVHNVNELCISCGTCVAICPKEAVNLCRSKNGDILTPQITDDCIFCGKCIKVCPGLNMELPRIFKTPHLGNYKQLAIGYTNDEFVRYNASSGGMITGICLFLLKNGLVDGIIATRMSKEFPLEAEVFIARTENEVIEAMGSKYCPAPVNTILKEIDSSKKYVFIGLPCHLHGLKNFEAEKKIPGTVFPYRFGLFCSRTPNFHATSFLLDYNEIPKSCVKKIKYRGNGHPGKFEVMLKQGKIIRGNHLHYSYWGFAFSHFFMQYRCWICADKTAYYSDISFADDWSIPIGSDPYGRNILIIRSLKGQELIKKLQNQRLITIHKIDANTLIRTQALKRKGNVGPRLVVGKRVGKKVTRYNKKFPVFPLDLLSSFLYYYNIKISQKYNFISTRKRIRIAYYVHYSKLRIIYLVYQVRNVFYKILSLFKSDNIIILL